MLLTIESEKVKSTYFEVKKHSTFYFLTIFFLAWVFVIMYRVSWWFIKNSPYLFFLRCRLLLFASLLIYSVHIPILVLFPYAVFAWLFLYSSTVLWHAHSPFTFLYGIIGGIWLLVYHSYIFVVLQVNLESMHHAIIDGIGSRIPKLRKTILKVLEFLSLHSQVLLSLRTDIFRDQIVTWNIVFYRQISIKVEIIAAIFSWWCSLFYLKSFLLLYLMRSFIIVNFKSTHQVAMPGPELFSAPISLLVSQIDFFKWSWALFHFFIFF